jgi:hypothetical protein
MANEPLWEVWGTFKRNGVDEQFNNVYGGKNKSEAAKTAHRDFKIGVRHDKTAKYGKLTVTLVESFQQ